MTPDDIANLAVSYGFAVDAASFKKLAISTRTNIIAAIGQHRIAEAVEAFKATLDAGNVTIVNVDTRDLNLTDAMWRIAQAVSRNGGVVTITPQGWYTSLPPLLQAPAAA